MDPASSITFTLSLWRPLRGSRQIERLSLRENLQAPYTPSEERLLEQLYMWTPGEEDVFSSIRSAEDSQQLRNDLIGAFAAAVPVDERTIGHLKTVVNDIEEQLCAREYSTWSDAVTAPANIMMRIEPVLALVRQLQWLCQVFGDVPSVSVLVR